MTGKVFNNWIVLERDNAKKGKGAYWICQCQCDNKTIRSVSGVKLRSGSSKSCGCIHKNHKENSYDLSGTYGIGYTVKGEAFFFDLEDYDKISNYYWYIDKKKYVCTREMGVEIKMHRLIMDAKEGQEVDHVNHINYDNRKSELRIATHNQNMFNKVLYKNNSSGHKGVLWSKRDEKWVARIQVDKKQVELGRFTNIDDAVRVREAAEKDYYGEYRYKAK